MLSVQTDEGLLVDREWICRTYGLSARWVRKELPVHSYDRGRALHLLTPEVVRQVSRVQPRRRAALPATRRPHHGGA